MFKKKYSLLKYFGKPGKKSRHRKSLRKKHKICKSNNHCKRYSKTKKNMKGG